MSAEDAVDIVFKPNPTQKLFIESRAQADLFSCRFGEGKSAALCWAVYYYTLHNPGAHCVLIRDTWENLQSTTLDEFLTWFAPGVCGVWVASRKTYAWSLSHMGAGASVKFLGMDDKVDASRLQSLPIAMFGMDEPAPAAGSGGIDAFIFTTAMGRLRQKRHFDARWYAAKLATNSPDESHWTYKAFVKNAEEYALPKGIEMPPLQEPGYKLFRAARPENLANLPAGYYETMRHRYEVEGRLDLARRFVDGDFGYQQEGVSVTPQWNEKLHLVDDLRPSPGTPLSLCWDFGGGSAATVCLITQVTPRGHWNFLEALVGMGMGCIQTIDSLVRPALEARYSGYEWTHYPDPAGKSGEQSDTDRSVFRVLRDELGGRIRPGAISIEEGIEPLRAVLSRTIRGVGLVQVDRKRAELVAHALRGGWHYAESRAGVIGDKPIKNEHSHVGDAARYGASRLFPRGQMRGSRRQAKSMPRQGRYWSSLRIGPGVPGSKIPKGGETIGGPSPQEV